MGGVLSLKNERMDAMDDGTLLAAESVPFIPLGNLKDVLW